MTVHDDDTKSKSDRDGTQGRIRERAREEGKEGRKEGRKEAREKKQNELREAASRGKRSWGSRPKRKVVRCTTPTQPLMAASEDLNHLSIRVSVDRADRSSSICSMTCERVGLFQSPLVTDMCDSGSRVVIGCCCCFCCCGR